MEVAVESGAVMRYPDGFIASWPLNSSVAGAWPTHQWNNAPFMEYLPESLEPSGPRTVALVVGTPCPGQ